MPEKTPSIHEWPVQVGDYVQFGELSQEQKDLLMPAFDPAIVCTVVKIRSADTEGPSVLYVVPGTLSSVEIEKNVSNSIPVSIRHLKPLRAN
ncbi:hypothetical protein CL644_00675 [bacterium]|nr:hypothetical protein [bacterium]|tara:strand:+ start:12969 stop:13244 length:276 start_codon:yes stop_codon:yes gene_type:complete